MNDNIRVVQFDATDMGRWRRLYVRVRFYWDIQSSIERTVWHTVFWTRLPWRTRLRNFYEVGVVCSALALWSIVLDVFGLLLGELRESEYRVDFDDGRDLDRGDDGPRRFDQN